MAGDFNHSLRKPDGILIATGPMGEVQADCLQCAHCQTVWVYKPGSGRKRGFCTKCHHVTCGAPACEAECVCFEKRLDLYEAGKRLTL